MALTVRRVARSDKFRCHSGKAAGCRPGYGPSHASRLHRAAGARCRGRVAGPDRRGCADAPGRLRAGGARPAAAGPVGRRGRGAGRAAGRGGQQRRRRAVGRGRAAPPRGRGRRGAAGAGPGPPGRAGRPAPGRRPDPRRRDRRRVAAVRRADLVLDGIVGISGRGALREPARRAGRRGAPGRGAGARRRPAQRRGPRHRRGRRPRGQRDRDGHLRRAQAGARAGRGPLRSGAPGRHRAGAAVARRRTCRCSSRPTWPPAGRCPARPTTSTPRG